MAIARAVQDRIRDNPPPVAPLVRDEIGRYLAAAGIERRDLAERAGVSYMSLRAFLAGYYKGKLADTDVYIREKLWRFLQAHPVRPSRQHTGPRFNTRSAETLQRLLSDALEKQRRVLVESPPGTGKSYILENFYVARNRSGARDAAYVYAGCDMTASALLRAIGRSLGLSLRGDVDRLLHTLLYDFSLRKRRPPLIIVDEAQHLVEPYAHSLSAVERLRELVDRSGCGLLIASSHAFYPALRNGGGYLWQWIRRFNTYERLAGLEEDEAVRIAEEHLGRAFNPKQRAALLRAIRETRFGRNGYYSCGLLWEQLKALKSAESTNQQGGNHAE